MLASGKEAWGDAICDFLTNLVGTFECKICVCITLVEMKYKMDYLVLNERDRISKRQRKREEKIDHQGCNSRKCARTPECTFLYNPAKNHNMEEVRIFYLLICVSEFILSYHKEAG